jgi:putative membrane protein
MMWTMWDVPVGMGWWMGFGVIWIVLFWGGLIALIVWGIKKLTAKEDPVSRNSPLDIARERYARGDISRGEFEQIRKDLS